MMSWQRKGSGRAYNSRPEHGILNWTENGKIYSYGTCVSNCKQCEVNKVTGQMKEYHCVMKQGGISKAMESGITE